MAPDEVKKAYAGMCQKGIDFVMVKFRPLMGDVPNLREKKNLVLLVHAAEFNAFADYQKKQILLPLMWCIQTTYAIEAAMQMHLQPALRDQVKAYLEYLNERQREAAKDGFEDLIPLRSFNDFAQVPSPNIKPEEERSLLRAKEDMLIDAIAFVLGHEIGHLALKHSASSALPPEQSRDQENSADLYGATLLKKAGFSILPGAVMLQRFLQNEAILKGISPSLRTHPRAECRYERILSNTGELDELLQNPKRRKEFETGSTYTVPQYRSLMRELRKDCRKNP